MLQRLMDTWVEKDLATAQNLDLISPVPAFASAAAALRDAKALQFSLKAVALERKARSVSDTGFFFQGFWNLVRRRLSTSLVLSHKEYLSCSSSSLEETSRNVAGVVPSTLLGEHRERMFHQIPGLHGLALQESHWSTPQLRVT